MYNVSEQPKEIWIEDYHECDISTWTLI